VNPLDTHGTQTRAYNSHRHGDRLYRVNDRVFAVAFIIFLFFVPPSFVLFSEIVGAHFVGVTFK